MTELAPALIKLGGVAAFSLAAIGSALGTGTAAMAGIGAWKKCYLQGKTAPFILLVFIGAPLSQTIYGLLMLINFNKIASTEAAATIWPAVLGAGIIGGIAVGFSAWYQGKTSAAANDSIAETGQGLTNCIISIGIVETVALFVTFLIGMAFK
ncbi:MAG: V-type ATP synthase subunit K [Verrucomicrobia bacterium]|nr:V-type ATP synthase subunit K [Verrucomicrobiota bacterium]